MRKGDIVTIRDSSYSKVITVDGLKSSYEGLHNVKGEQGIVVEVGCKFPNPHKYQKQYGKFNNAVVRTNSGKVIFIEEHFLKLVPTHSIMIGIAQSNWSVSGEVIEISDELYQKIKNEKAQQTSPAGNQQSIRSGHE